jgi:hypothetical protein
MTAQHILLTAFGREQRNTVYELHGSTVEEPLAPLALLRLLPQDARPNRVVALCTQGARRATWETFANGVRQTLDMEAERLDIPDGRTADEIRQIVDTEDEQQRFRADASRWLLESDEILVNLTGGTTLMGMAVQHLMDRGRDLDRPCFRFVLIDRRPPEQQRADPYVKGEVRWLDQPQGVDHAED